MPEPLHPAVVHLPIALALVVPLVALFALVASRLGWLPTRGWLFVVLLQALLLGSGWASHETGEEEEERVERVVAERHIEDHEKRAERLMQGAALALLVGDRSRGLLVPGDLERAGERAGSDDARVGCLPRRRQRDVPCSRRSTAP